VRFDGTLCFCDLALCARGESSNRNMDVADSKANREYRNKALASTEDQENERLLADSEGSITFKDLWLDIRFWNLNIVDLCEYTKPLDGLGR